jgi:hypothetical protein
MASISLGAALPAPLVTPLNVGPVAAAAPLAFAVGQATPLPVAQPMAALAELVPQAAPDDGAAMRPDQAVIARQVAWPAADGAALAASWRALVQAYGTQLAARERQDPGAQLPATLLAALQDARVPRQQDAAAVPGDAWRFTVHTRSAREQHLHVITGEPEQPPGRRRRHRAALRLELVLDDGAMAAVQVEPTPSGLVIELCTLDAALLERLRGLQATLEAAATRAGLSVLRWRYHLGVPAGSSHARLAPAEAVALLTLPVFRALAEMALALPLQGR